MLTFFRGVDGLLDSMSIDEMKKYLGVDEVPNDFDEFWDNELTEISNRPVKFELLSKDFDLGFVDCYDLYFDSLDNSKIYSKVLFPKDKICKKDCPVLFKFHGYQGQSADWSEAFKYVAAGIAVVMMDVRGQAGKSEDLSKNSGNTVKGHIIRGVESGPDKLFYKQVYLDIYLLINIVSQLPKVDKEKMMSYGESQGGALALISAALHPKIYKVWATYPFLSDFRRVLNLHYDTEAYDELHRFFKFQDPFYERESEIFNTLAYIDVKNFAHRISQPVQMVCGLMDDVCPPSTQFAIYNRLDGVKNMCLMPEYGHEAMNIIYQDKVFEWVTGRKLEVKSK